MQPGDWNLATCNLCSANVTDCPGKCWASGLEHLQGDGKLLYAGSNGQLIASQRLSSIRDGLEDHELLAMLEDKHPGATTTLVEKVVNHKNAQTHITDVALFSEIRLTVIEALQQ